MGNKGLGRPIVKHCEKTGMTLSFRKGEKLYIHLETGTTTGKTYFIKVPGPSEHLRLSSLMPRWVNCWKK